jgi:trimeric autotransporter adhesin
MANDYFVATGNPATRAAGSSAVMRAQFTDIEAAFDKLPDLTANANKVVVVNAGSTGLTVTAGTLALTGNMSIGAGGFTTAGSGAITLTSTGVTNVTLPTTGTLATLAGSETLSNKTLAAPVITGALTYGGIALTAAVTGTGKMVLDTNPTLASPTFTAPALGTVASGNIAACTGFPGASSVQSFLESNVTLNNTASYFDGPTTGSIGASGEIWMIEITALMADTAGAAFLEALIHDGTNYLTANVQTSPAANQIMTVTGKIKVTLSAATTFTLRARDQTSTSGLLLANQAGAIVDDRSTSITATRLK